MHYYKDVDFDRLKQIIDFSRQLQLLGKEKLIGKQIEISKEIKNYQQNDREKLIGASQIISPNEINNLLLSQFLQISLSQPKYPAKTTKNNHHIMKKSKGSKTSEYFENCDKTHHIYQYPIKKMPKDDEEQEMIDRKDFKQIQKLPEYSYNQPKYYHIINQNLIESDYQDQEGNMSNFGQLTLKNLIIFLFLFSLLMVGTYKIIEEVHQVEHPDELRSQKTKEKRLSMQKQGITVGKQQMKKAQNEQKLQGPQETPNPLQMTQNRFRQKNQGDNGPRNNFQSLSYGENASENEDQQVYQLNENTQKASQSQSEPTSDKKDSRLREKELDIIQSLLNANQKQQNPQIANQQQPRFYDGNPQANNLVDKNDLQTELSKKDSNPVILNSGQYLWQNEGPGPLSKASITKAHAMQWKNYFKMIELPVGASCQSHPMLQQEYNYFEDKYQISSYPELPICVVVPSFNNAANDRYRMNIQSILQQNYTNYHVVFIDDMSDDRTGDLLREYLSSFEDKYRQKVKIIVNQERKMAMPNLRYAAINECQEQELFIIVDGDDALIGRQVFKLFSAVMQKKNLWVMWTNFLSPKGTIGYSREYPEMHRTSNKYRKAGFVMSHLRAYYTKLFRLIKDEDLRDENGEYFHAANDVAIGIPILEMAHMHTAYVPEISYFYNINTGLNNHRVRLKQQKNNDQKIRKKKTYDPLSSLDFITEQKANPQQIEIISIKNDDQVRTIQQPLSMDEMEYNLHQNSNKAYMKEHKNFSH